MLNNEIITHNLCTQGFHIIDDFLESFHYQALQTFAHQMHEQGLFRSAKIGLNIKAKHNNTIRTDKIVWLDEESTNASVQMFLKKVNHVALILNQMLFLGLCEFETHFAVYQSGSFYKKHCDQFTTTKTRKISCVYYLNNNWTEDLGGALKLYNLEDQLIQTVLPQGNRFICFNSELPHEVCCTHHPRYSIAGWLKTRALHP